MAYLEIFKKQIGGRLTKEQLTAAKRAAVLSAAADMANEARLACDPGAPSFGECTNAERVARRAREELGGVEGRAPKPEPLSDEMRAMFAENG